MSLFENQAPRPLADRLRPKTLAEVVGQDHLLGADGPIGRMVAARQPRLDDPVGSAGLRQDDDRAAARRGDVDLHFEPLSAVFSGVADLRKVFEAARKRRDDGPGHAALRRRDPPLQPRPAGRVSCPYVEDGTVDPGRRHHREPVLRAERRAAVALPRSSCCAGSTTRRSRPCCSAPKRHLGQHAAARPTRPRTALARDGRWRRPLPAQPGRGARAAADGASRSDPHELARLVQRRAPLYDKAQEGHYNLISALHKSLRGSDTDAALYWLARMLAGGEDPIYIARRLIRAAVEDIGLADPQALRAGARRLGHLRPARLARGRARDRAVRDLSRHRAQIERRLYRPSARRSATAQGDRLADAADAHPQRADPADARSRLRQGLCLRPRHRGRLLRPELFPRRLARQVFYRPIERGFEREIKKRLDYWEKLRGRKAE